MSSLRSCRAGRAQAGPGRHSRSTPAPARPGPARALAGQEPADRGPRALGLVGLDHVAAVVDHLDPAARDPAAELLRVPDRDQRVLAPPDDERRHLDAVQPAAEAVVGDRPGELRGAADVPGGLRDRLRLLRRIGGHGLRGPRRLAVRVRVQVLRHLLRRPGHHLHQRDRGVVAPQAERREQHEPGEQPREAGRQVGRDHAAEPLAERRRPLKPKPELAGQLGVDEQQLPVRLHLPDRLRVAG